MGCLFIVATISRLDILEMFKGIWPFILLALGVLSLLILFPPDPVAATPAQLTP